jgi:hypothetical protein
MGKNKEDIAKTKGKWKAKGEMESKRVKYMQKGGEKRGMRMFMLAYHKRGENIISERGRGNMVLKPLNRLLEVELFTDRFLILFPTKNDASH